MLTWNQLNIHVQTYLPAKQPWFYNHLVAHIHHMYKEGLLYTNPDDKISVINDPAEMIPYLNNQKPLIRKPLRPPPWKSAILSPHVFGNRPAEIIQIRRIFPLYHIP